MSGDKVVSENLTEFEWLTLRNDMDKVDPLESGKEKFIRKVKENPFVPMGCITTAFILSLGLSSMRKGNSKMSQTMMRLRIAAQGFTVAALIGGMFIATTKEVGNK